MIYAIRKGSQQDGPGTRTVVLFKGCSFSCWWCPTPELQSFAQELRFQEGKCVRCGTCVEVCTVDAAREDGAPDTGKHYAIEREVCIVCGACVTGCEGQAREVVGQCMSVNEVMAQIAPDAALLNAAGGGVTFAGGEPLMQPDFLLLLLQACKALGLHTSVDTSGYTPWEFLERISPYVDLFLFDLKIMDDERHRQFTGLSNGLILENLAALSKLGQHIILRVPVIPGITDDADNLTAITRFAAGLPHLENIMLMPYSQTAKEKYERLGKPYLMTPLPASDVGRLTDLAQQIHQSGLEVSVVGTSPAE